MPLQMSDLSAGGHFLVALWCCFCSVCCICHSAKYTLRLAQNTTVCASKPCVRPQTKKKTAFRTPATHTQDCLGEGKLTLTHNATQPKMFALDNDPFTCGVFFPFWATLPEHSHATHCRVGRTVERLLYKRHPYSMITFPPRMRSGSLRKWPHANTRTNGQCVYGSELSLTAL